MKTTDLRDTCFKGITFRGWRDVYCFSVACEPGALTQAIAAFYSKRKAQRIDDATPLSFVRGSRLWTYLSPGPETWPFQTILVDMQSEGDGQTKVTVTYEVPGWFIRTPPFALKQEAIALLQELSSVPE